MDPEVAALCRELAGRSPAERAACYSQRQTPEAVRAEVESLLRFDGAAGPHPSGWVAAAVEDAVLQDPSTPSSSGRGLTPGHHVGAYQVVSLLGVGGMGEVYRARDSVLHRDVALKVLPPDVARDADRIARFAREARMLAALNHPHIAQIYTVAETGDVRALVMELVEGETLADRIARGPLPANDALAIARQIADALEAAHELGIIHRDLKPANVKVKADGTVKVLDFGLAKALQPTADDEGATITHLDTGQRVIAGTPAYMSPEQARGLPLDRRTDIWAFGVVLYEMLTGRLPFEGAVKQDTAALTADPDWQRIPANVQPLLRRCLEADPRQRLRGVGDFSLMIELASGAEQAIVPQSRRWPLAVAGAAVAAITFALAAAVWFRPATDSRAEPVRLTTILPPGVSVTRGPAFGSSVAVSLDGRTLVVAGSGKGSQQLYRRTLDRLDATPIAGTERGASPFFSHDGAWIGFFADGRMKRVPANGGAAIDITSIQEFPTGASWGPDDRIVFGWGAASQLHIVDSKGGDATPLIDTKPAYHPDVLPDANTVLFESGGWVHVFDRETGRETRLVQGTAPRYVDGHLILARGATLLTAGFNASRHELTGPLVPFVEGVAGEPGKVGGMRHYAIAPSGTLAYVPAAEAYELVLVQADGTERILSQGQSLLMNPQFSPDGQTVVVATSRRPGEPADLWMHDLRTGAAARFTFDGGNRPIWTPDGASVTYSHLGSERGIYSRSADGRGDAKQILRLEPAHWLAGWTPDGSTLAYGVMEGTFSSLVAFYGGESQRVVGPGSNWGGRLSPDGRWIVYHTLDSGSFEVYVTSFPQGDARWLIAAGSDPTWGPDGNEIYYRSGASLMAARVDRSAGIRVLSTRVVIEPFLPPFYDDYDIHPDGRTLVIVRPSGDTEGREVTMVLNPQDELSRLVAAPGK